MPGQPGRHRRPGRGSTAKCTTARCAKSQVRRVAVGAVLLDRVLDGLAGERVLQLGRRDRDAVDEQAQVERLVVRRSRSAAGGYRQPVRRVALDQLGRQPVGGLEVARAGPSTPWSLTPWRSTSTVPRWSSSSASRSRNSAGAVRVAAVTLTSSSHASAWVAPMKANSSLGVEPERDGRSPWPIAVHASRRPTSDAPRSRPRIALLGVASAITPPPSRRTSISPVTAARDEGLPMLAQQVDLRRATSVDEPLGRSARRCLDGSTIDRAARARGGSGNDGSSERPACRSS